MEKQGLWTRIRNQYGNASAALSQLSISSTEHDGDNENDTAVHHALVRYYMQKDGHPPPWLDANPSPNASRAYQHGNASASSFHGSSGGGATGIQRNTTARGGSALEDIYKRREQRMQQQQQQQQQYQQGPPRPGGLPQRSQTFSGDASQGQRSDRFKNKLKSSRANW